MNSFLSSFPKLTCHLMSSGNLTYFRRLYLMCLSTCSMKQIILLTLVTILPNQWSQPTEMHLHPVPIVTASANKVPCPFPKGGTLLTLPCNKDKILPPVLCKDTGCPDVKFPALPLTSTPSVSGEKLTNAASIFVPIGKSEIFEKLSNPIPCNCIMCPLEERVLPSSIQFTAQNMTASHPRGVDEHLDSVPGAPIPVQPTSTQYCVLTSPDEPLNCPRLVLMVKGQPQ